MRKYETLIFDLDDTLINNKESVRYAFKCVGYKLHIPYNEKLFEKWLKFDIAYWNLYDSSKMHIPSTIKNLEDMVTYVRANRFMIFFKELNLTYEQAVILNELYCNTLGMNIVEIDGARKLLESLSPDYEIAIATNGPRNAAISKIRAINIDPYISFILSSEEIGFSKPMPEYFEHLFNQCMAKDKSKLLIIGDTFTTDIIGGIKYGIDTCWFNPNNCENVSDYKPTMTINKLLHLKKKI